MFRTKKWVSPISSVILCVNDYNSRSSNLFPVMNNLVSDPSFVYAVPYKFLSLGKDSGLSGLHLYENHFVHIPFGETIKNYEVHRRTQEPGVLRVIFEVREIGNEVFRDFAADDGFTFLYGILADLFFFVYFPGPEHVVGSFGDLLFHLTGLPGLEEVAGPGLHPAFHPDVFEQEVDGEESKKDDQGWNEPVVHNKFSEKG